MSVQPVSRFMSRPAYTIPAYESLPLVHRRFAALDISSLGVVDAQGELIGVISVTDLLRFAARHTQTQSSDHWECSGSSPSASRNSHIPCDIPVPLLALPPLPVTEAMTRRVVTVRPNDSLAHACRVMVRRQVHRVYAEDEGMALGVLGIRDVMQATCALSVDAPLELYMSRALFTVDAEASLAHATALLSRAHISGVIVVEDGQPIGVFSQDEALKHRALPADTPVAEAMDTSMVCMPARTPMHRAAGLALAAGARRVIACTRGTMIGVISGLDFARAMAETA